MDTITVCAINPDNKVEVSELVEFFKSCYSDNYPIKGVYDERFWHMHLGSRFYSLIVRNEEDAIVAHFGVCADPETRKNVRIVFPTILPDFNVTTDFTAAITKKLSGLAERQGWRCIYYFLLDQDKSLSKTLSAILGGEFTALCPNYFCEGNSSTSALVAMKSLRLNEIENTSVYLSDNHREFANTIYNSLKIKREIYKTIKKASASALPAEKQAVETHAFSETNVVHVFIEPSLISKKEHLLTKLGEVSNKSHLVFVNIQDPNAVEVGTILESAGYVLSGILPIMLNKDQAVYVKSSAEPFLAEPLFKSAAFLYDYLNTQENKKLMNGGAKVLTFDHRTRSNKVLSHSRVSTPVQKAKG